MEGKLQHLESGGLEVVAKGGDERAIAVVEQRVRKLLSVGGLKGFVRADGFWTG
jgi:hypothetical protein